MLKYLTEYLIFSIRRPRLLFQTWPGGPGVCLTPAIYSNPVSLSNGFYSLFLTKMYLANVPTAYYTFNKYLNQGPNFSSALRPGV